jgi:hypothetical protein
MGTTIIEIQKPADINPEVTVYFGENNEYAKNIIAYVSSSAVVHYNLNLDSAIPMIVYVESPKTVNNTTYTLSIVLQYIETDLRYVQTIQNFIVPEVVGEQTIYNTVSVPVAMLTYTNTITVNQVYSNTATITIEPDKHYVLAITY